MVRSEKGNEFLQPVKLNHFLITINTRGEDGNYIHDMDIMNKLGKNPTEIPVVLLYDDIELNFQTRYAIFRGKKCIMEGDGETWQYRQSDGSWKDGEKPVKQLDPKYTKSDRCKINGTLSVVIRCAKVVGGIWKFRTTGRNSILAILASLRLIQTLTSGHLAGIPLSLIVSPQLTTNPVTGNPISINVVNIVFKGDPEMLRERWLGLLQADRTYHERMGEIQATVRKYLNKAPNSFDEDATETIEEYYPEEAERQIESEDNDNLMSKIEEIANTKSKKTPVVEPIEEVPVDFVEESAIIEDIPTETVEDCDDKRMSIEQSVVMPYSNLKELRLISKNADINDVDKKGTKALVEELSLIGIEAQKKKGTNKNEEDKKTTTGVLEEPKQYETILKPKEQLKVLLVELGLDSEDLRHGFYKQYPMSPEEYIANRNKLVNNVDMFKKRLILTLKSYIPTLIENNELDEREKSVLRKSYDAVDHNNFDDIIEFYVTIKK